MKELKRRVSSYNTYCSYRGPKLDSQHPGIAAHLPVTLAPGEFMPTLTCKDTCAHTTSHMDMYTPIPLANVHTCHLYIAMGSLAMKIAHCKLMTILQVALS